MAGIKLSRRERIKRGIRKRLTGSAERPRLSVYRSNKGIYAQIIDDTTGKTLASAGSLKHEEAQKAAKLEQAAMVGKMIAENQLRGYCILEGTKQKLKLSFTLSPENPALIQEYHLELAQ